MEERELTQLLQQVGDRVTPGPPPLRRIVDAGEALRGRRSGRVRMFAVAAAAAAAIGGGAVAATVLELPSGGDSESAGSAGEAADAGGGGEDEGGATSAADLPVTPDVARPGEVVELEVPSDVPFRVQWLLERSVDDGWRSTHVLVDADFAAESGAPLSRRFDAAEGISDAPEVHEGPVPLVVPDDASPGPYRICQVVEDGTEWCGRLTVTG
jgi:hypothetical protein